MGGSPWHWLSRNLSGMIVPMIRGRDLIATVAERSLGGVELKDFRMIHTNGDSGPSEHRCFASLAAQPISATTDAAW